MSVTKSDTWPLHSEQDVVYARQAVRKLAQEIKFSLVDQTKIVTAASELARNAFLHGKGGEMLCELLNDGLKMGIRLTFTDRGPGIANMELAMTDGWTSGGGLGMGLSGSKRLVNEFEITSVPGMGTRIVIIRWK